MHILCTMLPLQKDKGVVCVKRKSVIYAGVSLSMLLSISTTLTACDAKSDTRNTGAVSSANNIVEETVHTTTQGDIQVTDAKYNGFNNGYHHFSFTVKNCTGKEINTVTIDINLLNSDEDIVDTTHPQEGSRLKDGQSITIDALNNNPEAHSAVVDGYSYICNDNYVSGYVDNSLKIVFKSDEKSLSNKD